MLLDYWFFAGLEVLGLLYVSCVLGFQHIVVKLNIFQLRGKKHDQAGATPLSSGTQDLKKYWKGLNVKFLNHTKIANSEIIKIPKHQV